MSEKWKDLGKTTGSSSLDAVTGGLGSKVFGSTHEVKNTDTGKIERVYTGSGQSVGDAIKNGQFKK